MAAKNIELTREDYNIIAKNRGIQGPKNMRNEKLLNTLVDMTVNAKKIMIRKNYQI